MASKSKIISFFRKKKVNTFALFLILALMFSVLTKLSKDYTHTFVFNTVSTNIPEDKIIVNDTSHVLNITLTTYGFKLIKYYLTNPTINVNFNNLEKNSTHYFWTEKREFSNVVSQFDPNVKIESINPDTIAFRFDVNYIKKIPIKLDLDFNFSSGFGLVNDYKLKPDSINVIGPKVITDTINQVVTEQFKMNNINTNISATVQLKLPTNINELKFSHNSVNISGDVERFTEGSFNVPVNITNIPENIKLKYYPKTVSVIYYTSLSNFKSISSSSFIVECDYSELHKGATYLTPRIVKQPNKVKNVRLNEKRIDFIAINLLK